MSEENLNPLVSVIINNYNYGRFLPEAIDSVLNQTYTNLEIIVVDDGSSDNSREVIASYQDKIVPVLKENGGQASAFNAGFKASSGDIICMLDSDDVFIPEKVTEIVKIFNHYPDIGWCFHRLRFVDAKTGEYIKLSRESGTRECDFRAQLKNGRLPFYSPATSGLCFGRSLLQQLLPMPEVIRITSDNYLKIAAAALTKGYFLDRQLAYLRLHGSNNYTEKPDKQHLVSKTAILTADSLRSKWPFLVKYANKLIARGVGIIWKIGGGLDADLKQVVEKYISTVSLVEKININIRAIYFFIKP
ncbi:glycosyltransferase family 2 protein [Gloeocapsopsis dulcis]|uniref:Glucosyl transferase n=1 Tax=Gloeocapsopsis dulcis AAB1 = 1H9 TaxID=1433147 RepID=A0A6N8G1Q8_9CHRO|nr:glycosyltransferase [Gloeocapsopsis dulcis]MUL39029.1 glucosyl transferase [Gloeocapsopsis dulcis AAB1 = 1H9]WNN90562.1 glycosyltransferase [Gloeocapsopsis dulcis]